MHNGSLGAADAQLAAVFASWVQAAVTARAVLYQRWMCLQWDRAQKGALTVKPVAGAD